MSKKILIVGGGGREHALAWKLHQDGERQIFIAPGNAGTSEIAKNVPIPSSDIPTLIQFAKEKDIYLTIVGPDDSLALGIVDAFQEAGLRIFGPTRRAAQIESSKAFAKELMRKTGIPTASYQSFTDASKALEYVRKLNGPSVVKASGLALGKGAVICLTPKDAEAAINEIMVEKKLGEAGNEVVIEDYLDGVEFSVHAIANGIKYVLFPFAQDHKQVGDGNQGPMTGGMGTIAPVPWVNEALGEQLRREVIEKTLNELTLIGNSFTGCLYPGIMQTETGPKVLEFNARFGDPETQVYMQLLESNLLELLEAATKGELESVEVKWRKGAAACVILASGGYPESYENGYPISGIEEAERLPGVAVFHAGTKVGEKGEIITNGGRVLGVSAYADTLPEALDKAYKAVDLIHFQDMHYRRDIGRQSLGKN